MAGIIAQVGTPYCGLTCLAAYSAFFSDNAGSYTVRKHEMSSHTCCKTSEKLNVEESRAQRLLVLLFNDIVAFQSRNPVVEKRHF